jgi:hypothetical protein
VALLSVILVCILYVLVMYCLISMLMDTTGTA